MTVEDKPGAGRCSSNVEVDQGVVADKPAGGANLKLFEACQPRPRRCLPDGPDHRADDSVLGVRAADRGPANAA